MAKAPAQSGQSTGVPVSDRSFFGHPKGLATLFFTEMGERFSYYGMRALLILFMSAATTEGGLGFDPGQAGAVYGLYTAMVYLAALPGGWLADRFLGQRKAVLWGGVLITGGQLLLAIPGLTSFYSGLAIVVAGTGLLKPNVSAIVGQLYTAEDPRRDAGFSVFYMGINLGAFIAPLVCGYIGQRIDWRYGFASAGIGMFVGLLLYLAGQRYLGDAGRHPAPASHEGEHTRDRRRMLAGLCLLGGAGLAVTMLARAGLVNVKDIADASGVVLAGTVVLFFGWLFMSASWTPVERRRLIVVGGLFLAAALFWSVFEQAGSTMNLFAQHNTDNDVAGRNIPASWYQSVNAIFIITLAPVFAWLWIRLGSREPSSPVKFALGLLLAGGGFMVLAGGAALAETGIRVSPMWLLVTYLLHTMGELCLSPVGLSAMTKLAPARVAGLMMGVWFMSLSLGNYIGGRLASFYESFPLPLLFGIVGGFAIAAGIIFACFSRPMVRLMGGVK